MNVDVCFQIRKYDPYMLHQYLGKEQHLKHGEFIRLQPNVEKVEKKEKNQEHYKNITYQIQLFCQLKDSKPL